MGEIFQKNVSERKEICRREKMRASQKLIVLRREIAKNGGDESLLSLNGNHAEYEEEEIDEKMEWQQIENEIKEKIEFLTKHEERERNKLIKDAFIEWNNKDFT